MESRRHVPAGFRDRNLHSGPRRPKSIGSSSAAIGQASRPCRNRDTGSTSRGFGKARRPRRRRNPRSSGASRPEPIRESSAPSPKAGRNRTGRNEPRSRRFHFSAISKRILEKFVFRLPGGAVLVFADHLLSDEPELFPTEFGKRVVVPFLQNRPHLRNAAERVGS